MKLKRILWTDFPCNSTPTLGNSTNKGVKLQNLLKYGVDDFLDFLQDFSQKTPLIATFLKSLVDFES